MKFDRLPIDQNSGSRKTIVVLISIRPVSSCSPLILESKMKSFHEWWNETMASEMEDKILNCARPYNTINDFEMIYQLVRRTAKRAWKTAEENKEENK